MKIYTVVCIDLVLGWKYGFPRPIPWSIEALRGTSKHTETLHQWILTFNYPKELLEAPSRMWWQEMAELELKKFGYFDYVPE